MRVCFLLLLAVVTFTCFVCAEKENLRTHDINVVSSKSTGAESGLRYLKSDRATSPAAEHEERAGVLNRLKSFLGLKASKIKPGQIVRSSKEANNLEKAASEISKTKFTRDEANTIKHAASYVTHGNLNQADVKGVQKTATEIAKNPSGWRETLKNVSGLWWALVVILLAAGIPLIAFLTRNQR